MCLLSCKFRVTYCDENEKLCILQGRSKKIPSKPLKVTVRWTLLSDQGFHLMSLKFYSKKDNPNFHELSGFEQSCPVWVKLWSESKLLDTKR